MANALVWLRRDLRLHDNPALAQAIADGFAPVLVYVHAPQEQGDWAPGAASRTWLHHSLTALQHDIAEIGGRLIIAAFNPLSIWGVRRETRCDPGETPKQVQFMLEAPRVLLQFPLPLHAAARLGQAQVGEFQLAKARPVVTDAGA